MPEQKYVLLAQNLALYHTGRVGRDIDPAKSFGFSFWISVAVLLQDRTCISPSNIFGFKRLCLKVIETEDFLGYIAACSSLREEMCISGVMDFDLKNHKQLRWTKGLLHTLSYVFGSSVNHPSSEFNALATFLGWLKRLPILIRPLEESVADYLGNDERLRSCEFDSQLLEEIELVWKEWFSSFTLTDPFVPKHGSGATADAGRVRSQKWELLGTDQQIQSCLKFPDLSPVTELPSRPFNRVAKVVFVPKQAGKDRTICMEPATLQYLQQGISRQLVDFTHRKRHPLSKLVNITSQDVNRKLCSEAFFRGLATVDLSDASDSVSWRLIKRIARKLPLLRYLYASRSKFAQLNGQVYDFDKFAPMGSALCFPIECYVFAAILEVTYRRHYGRASHGHLSGCSVYGDDIICPAEIYQPLVDNLCLCGFKVNTSKSFSSGYYYESCGVEYCLGVRIFSIRHPREHLLVEDVSPDKIDMISDLANSLYTSGYFLARRLLLTSYGKAVCKVGHRVIPVDKLLKFDDKHCLSIEPSRKDRIWHESFQCYMQPNLVCRIIPKRGSADLLEYLSRYHQRPRSVRISDNYHNYFTNPHSRWSLTGVTALARMKSFELLKDGDVKEIGACRTGPLQTKVFSNLEKIC